jgi:hypothetical protein
MSHERPEPLDGKMVKAVYGDEDLRIRTLVANKLLVCVGQDFPLENLLFARNHATVETMIDAVARRLTVQLRTYLLAGKEHAEDGATVRWPADWWQAFRERWFPKWWLRRWPVRYQSVVTRKYIRRVCPHVNLVTPGEHQVHFQWLERE